MSHEISGKAMRKLRHLHHLTKNMTCPTVYEEDGYYSTCGFCHKELGFNEEDLTKHDETCTYRKLKEQAAKLNEFFLKEKTNV